MDEINTMPIEQKKFKPKIIYGILIAVAIFEGILGIRSLTSSPTHTQTAKATQANLVSKASFYVQKTTLGKGDNVLVSIVINTGGHASAGTDAIIHYDPKVLEASGSAAIIKGRIYSDYPAMEVDQKTGLIRVSGVSGLNKRNFTGTGGLASVNFKAKVAGSTKLTFEFTPGAFNDTNIVDAVSGKDILSSVDDLTLTIK